MSLVSRFVNRSFKKSDEKRDAGLTTPDDIVRFDDIVYGSDQKWQKLDVYRPKNKEGKLPVIVSVHGGGWVYGDKELYQYYCMSLAQLGFAVINYTYRLAPEFKYPSSMEDTNLVFVWGEEHAEEYGLDWDNLFAVGDSAGAHMLALYACMCCDTAFSEENGLLIRGRCPDAVALNCGVYRVEKGKRPDLTSALMKDLLPGKVTAEELHRISPIYHLPKDFPAAFIMTAAGDFLASQAAPMTEALKALGVEAEYHYYGDKEHMLGHVFHVNMRLKEAHDCNRDEAEFFRRHIK